jgi:hypothetical protein
MASEHDGRKLENAAMVDSSSIRVRRVGGVVTVTLDRPERKNALIRQYAPGLRPGPLTIAGYVAAKVFEDAVEGTDDPTTSEGILAGLHTIRDCDVGGTTFPLTFTAGEGSTTRWCVWTVRADGGKWVSDGLEPMECGTGG